MNTITVFSINTNFHLMITKYYIQNYNINNAIIILNSKNPMIESLVEHDQIFLKKLIINRSKKTTNRLQIGFKNRGNIMRVKNIVKSQNIEQLIVFKDNDIINQTLIDIAFKKNVKITLIEDGLGLYTLPEEGLSIRRQNKIKKYFFSYPEFVINTQGINPKVNEIIASSTELLPEEKTVEKSLINKLRLDQLSREQIERLYDYFNINNKLFDLDQTEKPTILFIGQPFSENKLLDYAKEKAALDSVIYYLVNKKVNVIIKPHPSENIKKYNDYLNYESVYLF